MENKDENADVTQTLPPRPQCFCCMFVSNCHIWSQLLRRGNTNPKSSIGSLESKQNAMLRENADQTCMHGKVQFPLNCVEEEKS